MIGFEFICNLYNVQYKEVAEELGISKQTVNSWVSGLRRIPKKHLPKLSQIFNIPEEYFQKELDEIDKIKIQKTKIDNELKPIEYTHTTTDPETGEEIEASTIYYDYYETIKLKHTDYKIEKMELLKRIENCFDRNLENLKGEEQQFEEGIKAARELIKYYNTFTDLMENISIDKSIIRDTLKAIDVCYNEKLIGIGTEETPLLIDIINVLKNQKK